MSALVHLKRQLRICMCLSTYCCGLVESADIRPCTNSYPVVVCSAIVACFPEYMLLVEFSQRSQIRASCALDTS